MSSSSPNPTNEAASSALPAAVQQAFSILSTYDRGASRGALLPIDETVAQSKTNERARKELETLLVAVLRSGSEIAKDFACVKLTTIGTEASIPALTALLDHPKLAASARTALEAIPSDRASRGLREALGKLDGLAKVGVIVSLGARRDAGSTRALAGLLRSQDAQVQSAAAAALGELGSTRAAKALRAFLPKAPPQVGQQLGDACLVCAGRLTAENHKTEAAALYSAMGTSNLPPHILGAAKRGLAACAPNATA
jgi:HEAT repeat protein